MNRSRIEWCHFSTNPVRGLCPVGCSYCYARAMYHRFQWDGSIRYDNTAWQGLEKVPAGSRVFVGSTIDLFHNKTVGFLPQIMERVNSRPDVTFIFLTKQTQNLPRRFPNNCWVGASAINWDMAFNALWNFQDVDASVKFLSFEPLLDWKSPRGLEGWFRKAGISWVILGQCTPAKPATTPKLEWIEEIVGASKEAGIPYFLKDNLKALFQWPRDEWAYKVFGDGALSQEYPLVRSK